MNRNTNSISTPWSVDDTASSSSPTTSLESSDHSIDTDLSLVTSANSNSSLSSTATIPPPTFQSDLLPCLPPDSPHAPPPKKKQKTDRFQQFIDSAFHAMHQELWIDRCNDRHRRIEGNCAALDTKVNRDVKTYIANMTRYASQIETPSSTLSLPNDFNSLHTANNNG